MAPGMAASLTGLSSNMTAPLAARGAEDAEQPPQWIVDLVHHPLLEGDDGVVGDGDAFRANARAALRDVAKPHSLRLPHLADAVLHVERVHLQRSDVQEEARADELLVHLVLAQHVADVLAEEALDALAELLHALDVLLRHAPGAVGRIGWPRFELLDLPLHPVVPGDVGHQVAHDGEGLHRPQRDRPRERQVGEARHAHQPRQAVHLRRAGPALARLAVPAHREVRRLLGLDAVDRVEDHHPGRDLGGVVREGTAPRVASPDAEGRGRHHFISSTIWRRSARSSGIGRRATCMAPSGPRRTTTFILPEAASLPGWSSRKCAPRLSLRSRADRATASETVIRFRSSSAVCQPGLKARLPATRTRPARSRSCAMASSARSISPSRRTMPTRSCMACCSSWWMRYGPVPSSIPSRSNGASATRAASSTCASSMRTAPAFLANCAACAPARCPNTSRSDSEFPPRRFAPCRPAAHSPAANSPGTVDICDSASTRTPPMM